MGTPLPIASLQPSSIPVLDSLPLVGAMFFRQTVLVYLAFLLVPVVAYVLSRTTYGMKIKAVGENRPRGQHGRELAGSAGPTVLIGCSLAGLAGTSLMLYAGSSR